jgi:hypothetical protein
MQPRPCLIGLDEPEVSDLQARLDQPLLAYETLPRILVRDGELFVESPSRSRLLPVSSVVFHGIFGDDFDLLAGLALWGGPCLPSARAMLACRLKFPCLVRALELTKFGAPRRGFVSAGLEAEFTAEHVAKWGNWHCGENKARVQGTWRAEEAAILEPYLQGTAMRVVVIGDRAWQIQLAGDDWLKSIHHPTAELMPRDERLVADTRHIASSIGLEIAANDYIITADGEPHLLEVNHIPNVTRFPEIWQAYAEFVVDWLNKRP